MKKEYTSQELRRLPGVTYDTLRTWAGRRNTEKEQKNGAKRNSSKPQPVLLPPIHKPGSTHCWIYAGDAVERIWWIRMLQMLGVELVDHIIVSDGDFVSMRDSGHFATF